MSRDARLGVLAVTVLALAGLLLMGGCPKSEPRTAGPIGPPSATGPMTEAGPLAELLAAQGKLSSYKMVMTGPDGDTIEQFVKLEGGKPVKTKVITPEGWLLVDHQSKVMHAYSPQEKTAMKMPLEGPGAEGMDASDLDLPGMDLPALAAKDLQVSEETLDGVSVALVQYTEGAEAIKVWLDRQTGLPRQLQSGEDTIKVALELVDKVPAAEFELPSGTQVVDLSEMMRSE